MQQVLKFWAGWCQPCTAIEAPLREAADEVGVEVVPVNIEEEVMVAQQHRVTSLPTLVLLDKDGMEVKRVSGMRNKSQLLQFLGA